MIEQLREIVRSDKPDSVKVKEIKGFVSRMESIEDILGMLKGARGVPVSLAEIIVGLDCDTILEWLQNSDLPAAAYAHIDLTSEQELRAFIRQNIASMNFDMGNHYGSRTEYGKKLYDLTGTKGASPQGVANVCQMLKIAKEVESVVLIENHFQPGQICTTDSGATVRLIRQPNMFQWFAEQLQPIPDPDSMPLLLESYQLTKK